MPMHRYLLVAIPLICSVTLASGVLAQSASVGVRPAEEWTPKRFLIEVAPEYMSGVSASMRGSVEDFERETQTTYTNSSYPFSSPGNAGLGASGLISYRFVPSSLGVYLAGNIDVLGTQGNTFSNIFMMTATASIGGAYTYDLSSVFSLVGRLGINTSIIGGSATYWFSHDTITAPVTARQGFEVGGAINWTPGSFLNIGIGMTYQDLNVIGKSYKAPPPPPAQLKERELNDAANPADPNDHARTIDVLRTSLNLGVRF